MKIGEKYAKRVSSDDDNMVPLINVVFLMLVFFMVAGQVKKADPIAVVPPFSVNDAKATSDPNVVVVVGHDGTFYIDDHLQDLDDVRLYLEDKFTSSVNKEGFWVQVKADGNIALDSLRPVFNQIRLAGLTKVSLATQLERASK